MFKYRDNQQLLTIHIVASIVEYVFITVTCCEEIAKKLLEHFFCNYRGVRTHIFWRLRPHRVCRLHHCLANSGTFQDLALRFTGLSRTNLIFQDFPGPGNFTNTIPGLSRSLNLDFQDFLGPISFSRTFQVLEILQTQFQDFPGPWT